MAHIFIEIKGIRPGVPTVADLSAVIRDDKNTIFSMSAEVVRWVKETIDFAAGAPLTKLKNCCFAIDDGAEFIEFDSKGNLKPVTTIAPDWYPEPGRFLREQWLINNEMYDLPIVEFIKAFMETFEDVNERRTHCNLLFDLQLDQTKMTPASETAQRASKLGNKNRKSTAPKIEDLNSFEIFSQFFTRLAKSVQADRFPTMQVLTDHADLAKAPNVLKGSVRTWFKAVTGELPPNNKRVAAGNPEIFCAPIRTALAEVEEYGLEQYYHELSQAIEQAGDQNVADFAFKPFH